MKRSATHVAPAAKLMADYSWSLSALTIARMPVRMPCESVGQELITRLNSGNSSRNCAKQSAKFFEPSSQVVD